MSQALQQLVQALREPVVEQTLQQLEQALAALGEIAVQPAASATTRTPLRIAEVSSVCSALTVAGLSCILMLTGVSSQLKG